MNFGVAPFDENNQERTVEDLIAVVKDRLCKEIDEDLQKRIFFAICVHSLECWLLPLYASTKKEGTQTKGCLERLQKMLGKHNIKSSLSSKSPRDYEKLASLFTDQKTWKKNLPQQNPSLAIFLESLESIREEIKELTKEDDFDIP